MPFISDQQRKHFFANGSAGDGGGLKIKEMTSAQMDARENDYADYMDQSPEFERNPVFKNPMPSMTAEESAAWRAHIGNLKF